MPDLWLPPIMGLPPPLYPLKDVVISGNTTLTTRINYFRNLTVNSGVTLTGLAGGTIIVVQDKLTVAGTISVNGMGATGGAAGSAFGAGPGSGKGAYTVGTTNLPVYDVISSPSSVYRYPFHANIETMFSALVGGSGAAGNAWPGISQISLTEFSALDLVMEYIRRAGLANTATGMTVRLIGGGGGGGGGAADDGTGNGNGAGGAGIGSGGSGGVGSSAEGVGYNGGAGGNGGGVLLIFCGMLADSGSAGIVSADGAAGTNAQAGAVGHERAGGGAGGAGGIALVFYHRAGATLPTVRSNGGAAGLKSATSNQGAAANGGTGGSGYSASFQTYLGPGL